MEKKSLNIIIALAVLCLILAITTIVYYQKASVLGKQTTLVETADCSTIENQYFRDICYLQLAVGSPAHSYCKNMEISDLRDACYVEVSKLKKDKTICDFIDDKFYSRPKCYAEIQMMK